MKTAFSSTCGRAMSCLVMGLALQQAAQAQVFAPAVSYPTGVFPKSVAPGDFNHDGIQDLAVANANSGTVSILLGNGDGTFRAAVDYAAPAAGSIAVGDFNGDGQQDLIVSPSAAGMIGMLVGNGDGTFQAPTYLGVEVPASSPARSTFWSGISTRMASRTSW